MELPSTYKSKCSISGMRPRGRAVLEGRHDTMACPGTLGYQGVYPENMGAPGACLETLGYQGRLERMVYQDVHHVGGWLVP